MPSRRTLPCILVLASCGVADVESLGFDARRATGRDADIEDDPDAELIGGDPAGPIGGDPSRPRPDVPVSVDRGFARDDEPGPSDDGGRPPGPIPRGSEGGLCHPSNACDPGLACVEWPAADSANPIRTCALACSTARDCTGSTEGNRLCRTFAVTDADLQDPAPSPPVTAICVAATAPTGLPCYGSRRGNRTMTGCAEAETCMTNRIGDDEGTCAQLCIPTPGDPSGGCRMPAPFCNPGASGLTATSTGAPVPIGVCTVRRLAQGEICSVTDLTRSCDQSTATIVDGNSHVCIAFPDLRQGEGVCVETCARNGGSCGNIEPGSGPAVCTPYVAESQDPDFGLCVDPCSNFSDDCGGAGARGQGRFCEDTWVFEQNFPISFCVDRITPALSEAVVTGAAEANPVLEAFQDCRPGVGSEGDFYRCPEGTHCLTLQQGSPGQGACMRGCDTATTTPQCGAGMVCVPADPMEGTGICALP